MAFKSHQTVGNLSEPIRPEEFLSQESLPTFSLQDVVQPHQENQQNLKPRYKLTKMSLALRPPGTVSFLVRGIAFHLSLIN